MLLIALTISIQATSAQVEPVPESDDIVGSWLNIERMSDMESGPSPIQAAEIDAQLLRNIPRLAEAIAAADVIHEQLAKFIGSPIQAMPVAPTYTMIISTEDLSMLQDVISFDAEELPSREGVATTRYTAFITYNDNTYVLSILSAGTARQA
jgi:hypothetical protein